MQDKFVVQDNNLHVGLKKEAKEDILKDLKSEPSFINQKVQLTWKGITVNAGKTNIIKDLNGTILPGTITGLIGPSGCGKSTFIKCITSTIDYSLKAEGEVFFNKETAREKHFKNLISYVSHDMDVYEKLSILQQVEYILKLNFKGYKKKALQIINSLNMYAHKDKKFHVLSGGQKIRLCIATCLALNTPVVILDEPTTGLDSSTANLILKEIKNLVLLNRTVLISIHQPTDKALALLDSIIIMTYGNVVFQGTVENAKIHFDSLGFQKANKNINDASHYIRLVYLKRNIDGSVTKECTNTVNKLIEAWPVVSYEIKYTNPINFNLNPKYFMAHHIGLLISSIINDKISLVCFNILYNIPSFVFFILFLYFGHCKVLDYLIQVSFGWDVVEAKYESICVTKSFLNYFINFESVPKENLGFLDQNVSENLIRPYIYNWYDYNTITDFYMGFFDRIVKIAVSINDNGKSENLQDFLENRVDYRTEFENIVTENFTDFYDNGLRCYYNLTGTTPIRFIDYSDEIAYFKQMNENLKINNAIEIHKNNEIPKLLNFINEKMMFIPKGHNALYEIFIGTLPEYTDNFFACITNPINLLSLNEEFKFLDLFYYWLPKFFGGIFMFRVLFGLPGISSYYDFLTIHRKEFTQNIFSLPGYILSILFCKIYYLIPIFIIDIVLTGILFYQVREYYYLVILYIPLISSAYLFNVILSSLFMYFSFIKGILSSLCNYLFFLLIFKPEEDYKILFNEIPFVGTYFLKLSFIPRNCNILSSLKYGSTVTCFLISFAKILCLNVFLITILVMLNYPKFNGYYAKLTRPQKSNKNKV